MTDRVALVTVPVKSPLLSKTNITGLLIALFGLAGLFGFLPEGFDASAAVSGLVTAGGALVILFRSFSKEVLSSALTR